MAETENRKDDPFDSSGQSISYISLDEARVLAIEHARDNIEIYGTRYSGVSLVWEVVGQEEKEDHYDIRLSFRPAGRFRGEPGLEMFIIDKTGNIRVRQMLDEPTRVERPAMKRSGRWLALSIALLLVAAISVGVVYGITRLNGEGESGRVTTAATAPGSSVDEPLVVGAVSEPTTTPTMIPDSDGDGLTDAEERSLGTNPFQSDSDVDGLSDSEEIRIGTNPLSQDTDRDGVLDGLDLFPLYEATVEVSILTFDDHSTESFEPFGGPGEPYFVVFIDGHKQISQEYSSTRRVVNVQPFIFHVPDDKQAVHVEIQAWDSDFNLDDAYDISSVANEVSLKFSFDRLTGTTTISGDGTLDGDLSGPQAAISIRIESK